MYLKLYNWLSDHKELNILLLLNYYLLVVLPHEVVGVTIARIFQGKPNTFYNHSILAIFGILALAIAIPYVLRVMKLPNRNQHFAYMIGTIGLIILCLNTIIIFNIELIHILQYAVFAVLCLPLFRDPMLVLLLVSCVGAIDEAYQYFVLSPERTDYYDLNDVVFNTLGGALGLVWALSFPIRLTKRSWQGFVFSLPVLLLVQILLGITSLLYLRKMSYYPSEDVEALWTLVRKIPEGFWRRIEHLDVSFHISLPVEGLVYCCFIWAIYSGLYRLQSNAEVL